jgi:predicted N-acyltransferase
VFDWAWADAHDRALASHGHHYFPKLLGAVPFSPIPGQRLLVHPGLDAAAQLAVRQTLLDALRAECAQQGWSSAHLLFLSEAEAQQAERSGWLLRHGVQFHWCNREAQPFADYLKLPAGARNEKVRRCAIRLFGSEAAASPWLKKAAHHQALLQIYRDFCLEDATDCHACPFPEQLQQWRPPNHQ